MVSLETWVVAAQKGDAEAYGRIVERFQDMAYYHAFRYLGDHQQAQDAAQDAFIDAYYCLPSLETPVAFPAWFRRVVHKHCDRQVRGRQPDHLDDDIWRSLAAETPGPDQMLEQLQLRQAVQAAIHSLPEIYRQVTQLFYLHGRSLNDLALRLNLPISTIKKRLYTARRLLKEKMSPMTTPTYRPSADDTFANRIRFFIALKNSDLKQVRQLARRAPELLTTPTEWGVAAGGWHWPLGATALHWAASSGNSALAALLVEEGANINIPDQGGATPLKRAVHMGQVGVARWLLDNGADVNIAAANGQTALHAAVVRDWPEMLDLLLARGADATAADSQGRTPGDWAVVKGLPVLAGKLDAGDTAAASASKPEPTRVTVIWETGVKIIDLLAPLKWGGRNGLFTPLSGIGADVMLGELIHCMALHYGGTTVQLGLEQGDFTAESRLLQWRNCGVDAHVELFFGSGQDSDVRRRHLAGQGAQRALELAGAQPVLLLVYTDLALSDGVMAVLDQVHKAPNIITLFAGIESIGAEPAALSNLDAALTFDRQRAQQGLWPAIDPLRSYSAHFEDETHRAVAETAVRLCRRYLDLHPIYENQGMAGFDLVLYGEAERQAVLRARRLHRFLSQPLVVAEAWSATPGQFIPLAETLATTQAILDGELDDVPEEELVFGGRWSPRWT
jgi:RNA polymerase sigma factor (sigma-70 family)